MGIWRRIRLIPFNVTIPEEERDPELTTKLLGELSGILNWAIVGCIAWQSVGLKSPDTVVEAVDEYKQSRDTISQFISEECSVAESYCCKLSDLYDVYVEWCDGAGEKPLPKRLLSVAMEERGFSKKRGAKGILIWQGIKLAKDEQSSTPVYSNFYESICH